MGWQVITVWECELREPDQLAGRLDADLREEEQPDRVQLISHLILAKFTT